MKMQVQNLEPHGVYNNKIYKHLIATCIHKNQNMFFYTDKYTHE